MTVPAPFSVDCTGKFSTWHLPAMSMPEFIEDGDWTGYLCTGLDTPFKQPPFFDIPMQKIKISASVRNADPNILDLRSDGDILSIMGSFHFEGELWRDSGKLNLTRQSRWITPCRPFCTPLELLPASDKIPLDNGCGCGRRSGLRVAQWLGREVIRARSTYRQSSNYQ